MIAIIILLINLFLSSSTSQKKVFMSLCLCVIKKLWDFKKNLPSTFIYDPILMKIYMNTNNLKHKFFYFIKYDLKGHWRSHKVNFLFWNPLFLRYIFVLNLILSNFGMNANIIKTQIFYLINVNNRKTQIHHAFFL